LPPLPVADLSLPEASFFFALPLLAAFSAAARA
jgi:hypothetical protein